jgi:hypothetical protein
MRHLLPDPGFIGACVTTVFLAAMLLSCANREIDDSFSPVVDTEASIPVTAAAQVEESSPQTPAARDDSPAPKSTPLKSSASAYVDPWFLVAEVKGEKVYSVYVDTESIEEKSGGIQSWSKLVFEENQRDKDGLLYKEIKINSSIDCYGKTYTYNSSKFYDSIGQLVYNEKIEYNSKDITPDTLSAYIADFVCSDFYEDNSDNGD